MHTILQVGCVEVVVGAESLYEFGSRGRERVKEISGSKDLGLSIFSLDTIYAHYSPDRMC